MLVNNSQPPEAPPASIQINPPRRNISKRILRTFLILLLVVIAILAAFVWKIQKETLVPNPSPIVNRNEATADPQIRLRGEGDIEDYHYWLFENIQYPCGKSGNHEFLVVQKNDAGDEHGERHLMVHFHGGAGGLYVADGSYWPTESLASMLYAQRERTVMVTSALDDGLVKLIRENDSWRIMVPSYCSHDYYFGEGQYNEIDGYSRFGYVAATAAIDFTEKEFSTDVIVTAGTSAGASGAFYTGYQRDNVVGIVMDSNSMDLDQAAEFSKSSPVVPSVGIGTWRWICNDGKNCIEELSEKIGFEIGVDDPWAVITRGEVDTPLYYEWNTHDSMYAYDAEPYMKRTHDAILQYNPGEHSVAVEVCVSNPQDSSRDCTLHSPSKYNVPATEAIYAWIGEIVGE